MKKMVTNHYKKGFTLIELLVAATIIAVIMAIGMVSYTNTTRKSRDTKRVSDLEQIRTALEMYRADNGFYPNAGGGAFTSIPAVLVGTYIPAVPSDPKGYNYRYQATNLSSGNYYGYNLNGYLENVAGYTQSCSTYDTGCGAPANCNYCVKNP